MADNSTPRPRAKLNLGNVEDFKKPSKAKASAKKVSPKTTQALTKAIAEEQGFTSRTPDKTKKNTSKIDGRSLRATGRNVQFNIAVKPETKDDFWLLAQKHGFTKGEEFLLALMETFDAQS